MKKIELIYNTAIEDQKSPGFVERRAQPPRPLNVLPIHVETMAPKRKTIPAIK
jgi:hypothetical protein